MNSYDWVPDHLIRLMTDNDITLVKKEDLDTRKVNWLGTTIETMACCWEDREIYVGNKRPYEEKIISLCHEIGHLVHPEGLNLDPRLNAELAANTYVFENYDTLLKGVVALNTTIEFLTKCIKSYTRNFHYIYSIKNMENTIKILGIEQDVRFIGFNDADILLPKVNNKVIKKRKELPYWRKFEKIQKFYKNLN